MVLGIAIFALAWVTVARIHAEVRRRVLRVFSVLPSVGFALLLWTSIAEYRQYPSRWGWVVGAVLWSSLAALNAGWVIATLLGGSQVGTFPMLPRLMLGCVGGASVLGAVEIFSPRPALPAAIDLLIAFFYVSASLQFLTFATLAQYDVRLWSRAARALALANGLIAFGLCIAYAYFSGQPPPAT